jgi:hypothetical protein
MTASELRVLLRARYTAPEWAYFDECRNGTGHMRRLRTADGLCLGLYPSRGMPLIGFEIKVARQDWIKELKTPDKAEEIAKYCNQWYLVVSDPAIVKPGEMPATWGLLAPDKSGKALRIFTEAKPLDPEPLDRRFIASILRRASEGTVPIDTIEDRVRAEVAERVERQKSLAQFNAEEAEKKYQNLLTRVRAFEEASGVSDITSPWSGAKIGQAVRRVLLGDDTRIIADLDRLKRTASTIVTEIESAMADVGKVGTSKDDGELPA